jgi:hypothetical protein
MVSKICQNETKKSSLIRKVSLLTGLFHIPPDLVVKPRRRPHPLKL